MDRQAVSSIDGGRWDVLALVTGSAAVSKQYPVLYLDLSEVLL